MIFNTTRVGQSSDKTVFPHLSGNFLALAHVDLLDERCRFGRIPLECIRVKKSMYRFTGACLTMIDANETVGADCFLDGKGLHFDRTHPSLQEQED